MWRISKFFQIPLNDERMQDLNPFDLEFYELSMIADDPKKLEQLKNHYYDPEFDEWLEEFEAEQEEQHANLDMPDEDTIEYAKVNNSTQEDESEYDSEEYEEYEESISTDEISDWEEVK